jgi:hypothetical protein
MQDLVLPAGSSFPKGSDGTRYVSFDEGIVFWYDVDASNHNPVQSEAHLSGRQSVKISISSASTEENVTDVTEAAFKANGIDVRSRAGNELEIDANSMDKNF